MNAPLLSLCIIVRNSARTLRACLESIRPWVDEIILVDTGSIDETIAIAREFGAKIFHFPWVDDFAAARNVSLANATGKWLFWMDSDDTIDAENGRKLRLLAETTHPDDVLGFSILVRCFAKSFAATGDFTAVTHIKLVRNHPQIRFERRIHEQLIPSIKRLGGRWEFTDIFVTHSGSDTSPEGRARKTERDLRILKLEYESDPHDPFTLYNLGMTYNDIEEHDLAIRYLRECINFSNPRDSTYAKTHSLLVLSLHACQQHAEALRVCQHGLESWPDDPELLFRRGLVQLSLTQHWEAAQSFRESLRVTPQENFRSVEEGIGNYLSRHNLAAVYREMGRDDLAELEYRRIVVERPNYRPAYPLLAGTLVKQGRIATLEREIENLVGNPRVECEQAQMQALLAKARGDLAEVRRQVQRAVATDPDNLSPRLAQSEFLFQHGDFGEIVQSLTEFERVCPTSVDPPFNLAVIYWRGQQYDQALAAVERALKRKPDYGPAQNLHRQILDKLHENPPGSEIRDN